MAKKASEKTLEQRLIGAAWGARINVVRELLAQGADINFQDDEKNLPSCSVPVGDAVLREYDRPEPANPLLKGKCGMTALMCACQMAKSNLAEFLIDAGADLNVANVRGETALILAAGAVSLLKDSVFDKMLAKGADVNAQNIWGATPLMLALADQREPLALKLLEHGADPTIKTVTGHDAFYIARYVSQYAVLTGITAAMDDAVAKKKQQEQEQERKRKEALIDAEHRKNRKIVKASPAPKFRLKP